jgi:D-amino-acid dehydrogenase
MARPARCPAVPMVFEEDRVAVTPFRDGYRLGSMMEFNGYDERHDRRRLEILRSAARRYLHDPLGAPEQEEWWGWRPMSVDGVPIVGPAPALGNVMIATGHSMLGLTLACATGQLVAELLGGRTPHLDPRLYSPARF